MRAGCSSAIHAAALFGLFLLLLASTQTQLIVLIAPALLLWGIVRFLRAKERPSRRNDAIFLIIIGSIGLLLGMDEWRRIVHRPHYNKDREVCFENLLTIGRAIDLYASSNDGTRPATLAALYPKYLTEEDLAHLVCPRSKNRPGAPERIDAWTSYEYNSTGREWLCRDSESNLHAPEGRNVLTVDGRVFFLGEREVACQENLRRIGRALDMYAEANDGLLPAQLSQLFPAYIPETELKVLECPYRGEWQRPLDRIDEWTGYEYCATGKDWICRDRSNTYSSGRHSALQPDGHYSEGHNVLRSDRRIEFVKETPSR